MKKTYKLFVITFMAFFMSVLSVNAKKMTPAEIGELAIEDGYNPRFIYVIGKYAYTSDYKFNIQDIILAAADSIEVEVNENNFNEVLDSMTIYAIDRTYNGYTPTGWELGKNEVGNGEAFTETDIRYLNRAAVMDIVDANAVIDEALDTVNTVENTYFDLQKETDGTLTFNVLDRATTLEDIEGSGLIDALVAALDENDGIESFTIVSNGHSSAQPLVINRDLLNDPDTALTKLKDFVKAVTTKKYNVATLKDLVGKFTVTISLTDDGSQFSDTTEVPKTYTVNVKQTEVNTETLIDSYIESDNELYEIQHSGQNLTVTVREGTETTVIEDGMGSGVIAGLLEMVQEDGIKEIDFTYTEKNVNLNLTKETTVENLIDWFHVNAETIFDKTSGITNADLKGKSFTFKVVVDESKAVGAQSNPTEYTVTFAN